MDNFPRLEPAIGYLPSRSRQHQQNRSISDSPSRQRTTDDLLSQLTPRTAVDALRNPSGTLKKCMDAATHSEQAFAMRAAVASRTIQEWVEELQGWPWPTHDTSAGFERPPAKGLKLFAPKGDEGEQQERAEGGGGDDPERRYMGSLLATDVAKYEIRISQIKRDLEDMDFKGIERHVLHNHILPLSRPGTPLVETLRSGALSAPSYAHMDDFTAIVTSTVLQALPNRSRLSGLFNIWTVRLFVLRRSSIFLTELEDAEIALKAGWKAMEVRSPGNPEDEGVKGHVLSRSDFERMKLVVETKVARPGQHLDSMLDALEGRDDTLPEDWVDRMDAVEHDYAEWVATCERKIRGVEWAKLVKEYQSDKSSSVRNGEEERRTTQPSVKVTAEQATSGTPNVMEDESSAGQSAASAKEEHGTARMANQPTDNIASHDTKPDTESMQGVDSTNRSRSSSPPTIKVHPAEEDTTGTGEPSNEQPAMKAGAADPLPVNELGRFDGHKETTSATDVQLPTKFEHGSHDVSSSSVISVPENTFQTMHQAHTSAAETSRTAVLQHLMNEMGIYSDDDDPESDWDFLADAEVAEPDLPLMPRQRRDSELSNTSTVLHDLHSGFGSFSSDLPDVGTPDHRRLRDFPMPSTEAGDDTLASVENDDTDMPSSPPDFRSSTRSFSVSFNEFPTVHEVPEEGTPPRTPDLSYDNVAWDDEPSETFEVSEVDGSMRDSPVPAPRKVSVAAKSEKQLQQQISEILESIPAKIKLTTEPSAINLNPPDFKPPATSSTTTRSTTKPKTDPFPRSQSSMSTRSTYSRAGTPSFTLAPVYPKNRPRHGINEQEIKVFHLSRNGDAPIKLFIRNVGENGERVMVRVGGGWADLGEYLKEYASHHGTRAADRNGKVEIRDLPTRVSTTALGNVGSSPAAQSRAGSMPPTTRPASAMEMTPSPITPLHIRKARRSTAAEEMTRAMLSSSRQHPLPKTPLANTPMVFPSSTTTTADISTPLTGQDSRPNSRLSWAGDSLDADTSLGMAGPKGKKIEMTPESRAWVESVKEKVRIASGERATKTPALDDSKMPLGDMGKVGATKRLFRRGQTPDLRGGGGGRT